jgi:hypothetical protein
LSIRGGRKARFDIAQKKTGGPKAACSPIFAVAKA